MTSGCGAENELMNIKIVGRRQETIRGNHQRPCERSKHGEAKDGGYLIVFAVAGTRFFYVFKDRCLNLK